MISVFHALTLDAIAQAGNKKRAVLRAFRDVISIVKWWRRLPKKRLNYL